MRIGRYSRILVLLVSASVLSACGGTGAYRNSRFTVDSDWTSDREHLYARLGSPDSIENEHTIPPRPIEEGQEGPMYPFETWHYEHLNGVGDDAELNFVDDCMCGDYKLVDPIPSVTRLLAEEP